VVSAAAPRGLRCGLLLLAPGGAAADERYGFSAANGGTEAE